MTKRLANGLGIEWLANYKFCSVKNKLINHASIPDKLDEDFSNGEVAHELIRYECVHYGKPRTHKYLVDDSRPNTDSNAVGCECFLTYKCQEDYFELFKSCKKHLNHPETYIR